MLSSDGPVEGYLPGQGTSWRGEASPRHRNLARRAGVAGVALGLAVGVTAAPAQAMKPVKERVDCIDYGTIPKAPKGAVPVTTAMS